MNFNAILQIARGGITPGTIIELIKKKVSDDVGFKCEAFDIWIDIRNETVEFKIPVGNEVRKYPSDDPKVIAGIKFAMQKELPPGADIHVLSVKIAGPRASMEAYFEYNGQKETFTKEY